MAALREALHAQFCDGWEMPDMRQVLHGGAWNAVAEYRQIRDQWRQRTR